MDKAIEEAKAALAPFARVGDEHPEMDTGGLIITLTLSKASFRRASRALAALSAPAPSDDARSRLVSKALLNAWFDDMRHGDEQHQAWLKDRMEALWSAAPPTVSGLTEEERAEDKCWLIKKRGYFYRAEKRGYTARVIEAGRYTEADARAEASIEPAVMSAHHISEFQHELAHAEALLSPAPGIDWKRVAEVRERDEDAKSAYTNGYFNLVDGEHAHADRAFLLSLLPKQEANDGQ